MLARIRRELAALAELWLLPLAVAALPYRAGVALARGLARFAPLYAEAADAGATQWRAVTGEEDASRWRVDYRFAQLIDHADLFWALTRSRAFLLRRLRAPALALPRERPLLVLSFHYGQGLWLLHWLATLGHPPRFVSIRLPPAPAASVVEHAYARLRIAMVARLARAAPIFTGGARRAIADALAQGAAVYGLVDVPVPGGAAHHVANALLLGRPVLMPVGLLESAKDCDAAALVLTSRVASDGSRVIEAQAFARVEEISIGRLAQELSGRVERAPAAWHFWHLWPVFEAPAS